MIRLPRPSPFWFGFIETIALFISWLFFFGVIMLGIAYMISLP